MLKFKKRSKLFTNTTGSFVLDDRAMSAYSYKWFSMLKKIGKFVVLNTCRYSPTTARHFSDMLKHFNYRLEPDFEIHAPKGLDDLSSAHEYYLGEIEALRNKIEAKGSKLKKNLERKRQIIEFKGKMKLVQRLQKIQRLAYEKGRG